MKTLLVLVGILAILATSFALLGFLWMLSLALVGVDIGFIDSVLFGFLTKAVIGIFYIPVKLPRGAKAPSINLDDFRR